MLRPAAVLIAIALLLGLAACDDDGTEGITFKDPKGTIDVERGMRFTLEFSVNASVGYDWQPIAVASGVALVELKDTNVHYPDEESIGSSGFKRFVYEASDSGRQTLTFRKLYRGDPQERRTVTVNVRG